MNFALLQTLINLEEKNLSKTKGMFISLALVVFIGVSDFLTGPELAFSIFYLLPITIATVVCGIRNGLVVSLISAITWLIADVSSGHQYTHFLIPYWNSTVRLLYFCIHTVLLGNVIRFAMNMRDISWHDPMTGLVNWRYFREAVQRELA
ncbi:MAG: hypothetical protein QME74_06755 [Candidatus Edwardsbacteria bacterium]|nr:hypothetical protein [Candidatus Edwardsbacteria bacterium]